MARRASPHGYLRRKPSCQWVSSCSRALRNLRQLWDFGTWTCVLCTAKVFEGDFFGAQPRLKLVTEDSPCFDPLTETTETTRSTISKTPGSKATTTNSTTLASPNFRTWPPLRSSSSTTARSATICKWQTFSSTTWTSSVRITQQDLILLVDLTFTFMLSAIQETTVELLVFVKRVTPKAQPKPPEQTGLIPKPDDIGASTGSLASNVAPDAVPLAESTC